MYLDVASWKWDEEGRCELSKCYFSIQTFIIFIFLGYVYALLDRILIFWRIDKSYLAVWINRSRETQTHLGENIAPFLKKKKKKQIKCILGLQKVTKPR